MSRCKCDWKSEYATDDVFDRIVTPPTQDELEEIDTHFRAYLIVTGHDRRSKDLFCTACKESETFYKPRRDRLLGYDPHNTCGEYFYIRHGDTVDCPFCGRTAEVVHAGKMGWKAQKMYQRVQVVVFHAETDGWLSAQALSVWRDYALQQWSTDTEYEIRSRYLFRPGCAIQDQCDYRFYTRENIWKREWKRAVTIHEPFPAKMQDYWNATDSREYIQIGLEDALPQTDMRYSAAEQFAERISGSHGLICYLGEYCHRPQLEFLTKLKMDEIVDDLIYRRLANAHLVNWRADSLSDFLQLNKQYTKSFMATNRTELALAVHQEMCECSCYDADVAEYLRGTSVTDIRKLRETAGTWSMTKVVHYLMKQDRRNASWLWQDYIALARRLNYDLTEETVMFPKNLSERHDAAAETVEIMVSETKASYIKRRSKMLKQRYEYADDTFAIIVPKNIQSIIAEGKELHHCVGMYADRHCEGRTTILFLRQADDIERPYGTIEMGIKDDTYLRQLRGYKNCDEPRNASEEFIAKWLNWLKAGSPRDKNGKPIDVITMEVTA